MFGISKDRILFPDKNYTITHAIITPNYNYFTTHNNIKILEVLRNSLLERIDILSGSSRKYIKRVHSRVVTNSEEVESLLKKFEFETIIPEDHSVKEQFSLMTNVDFSVMPHGANAALILTQKKRSNFMEFFSSAYIVYHTIGIQQLLNLKYLPLVEARTIPPIIKNHHNGQFCNIEVPIKQLEVFLSNALLH